MSEVVKINGYDIKDLKSVRSYDTVALMKADTKLKEGQHVKTKGYYTIGDGGSSEYIIKSTSSEYYEELNNELLAELVVKDNTVNVLQFGAKGDGESDDTNKLQLASNYAQTNNLNLYFPKKQYLTNTITLENIIFIKIDGEIKLSSDSQYLNIYENVNGNRPNIYINKVSVGSILMKGLNSGDITIQEAYKLILFADNTTNHGFIAYNKFYLGFIRYLEIKDDGSGTKWINENLFIGGRFLGIQIGGGNSNYSHNNNLFLKPMCEHTTIDILYGSCNRIIDARLEGTINIHFSNVSTDNVIETNYSSTLQGQMFPRYNGLIQANVTDDSRGRNKVINNSDVTEHLVLSLNKFNNNGLTVDGDNIKISGRTTMFESDFISLPTSDIMLYFKSTNKKIYWYIKCYDESKNLITTAPDPSLVYNSPVIGYAAQGTYGNITENRNDYWAIIDSSNQVVKYIKIFIMTPSTADNDLYKNVEMYLTHYGKLENEAYYIKGFGTQVSS